MGTTAAWSKVRLAGLGASLSVYLHLVVGNPGLVDIAELEDVCRAAGVLDDRLHALLPDVSPLVHPQVPR
jgi:hypothetical protein